MNSYSFLSAEERRDIFREFYLFNERFLSELAYYRRPLKQFLGKYSYKGEFSIFLTEFLFSVENGEDFIAKTSKNELFYFFKKEEKKLIFDYFSMLGRGDSVAQKSYFSSIKEGIITLRKEAEQEEKRCVDLYTKLGFLFGLFILILIV